jgi:hypothetical protein
MLDVHPPHHAATTWRDFIIHIATIVVGLLIAVGLEQTVEYIHHRHQVAETREALRVERAINRNRFAVETDESVRYGPLLKQNLETLLYIRQHPKSTPDQWPHALRWSYMIVLYDDSAWKTAQQSTVLQYMPRAEVADYSNLYAWLAQLNEKNLAERQAQFQAASFGFRDPNPANLSSVELDREIESMTQLLNDHLQSASEQRRLARYFPDFKPIPTNDQMSAFSSLAAISPEQKIAFREDNAAVGAAFDRLTKFEAQFKQDKDSTSQEK